MKHNLCENIRKNRKNAGMTQEQLAEAVGVTVGAVSKWELGQSTPDLLILIQLADFFQCSVDALIGYEVQNNDREHLLKRIRKACDAKEFAEGIEDAEKALQKFPNDFEIVYQSVLLFHAGGLEQRNEAYMKRALELGERALLLYDRTKAQKITETEIQYEIAMAHLNLGNREKAVEIMKQNNPAGVYNWQIGYVLSYAPERQEEALECMSNAWLDLVQKLISIGTGYFNLFQKSGQQQKTIQYFDWILSMLPGMTEKGEYSVFTKWEAYIRALCGIAACELEDEELAKQYFYKAKELALRYDKAPLYDMTNVLLYYRKENKTIVDGIGSCVMDVITQECEAAEKAQQLWKTIENEE